MKLGFFIGLVLIFAPVTVFAAPTVSTITDSGQVGKYNKFEATFQVTTTAGNPQFPYDSSPPSGIDLTNPIYQGISVDGLFLPPGGTDWNKAFSQPAFYYRDYLDGGRKPSWANDGQNTLSYEWYYPSGQHSWKIRFAPNTEGVWKYRIKATDASGTMTTTDDRSFTVIPSTNRGFIQVSSNDKRYFEYSDGTLFFAPGIEDNFDMGNPVSGNNAKFSALSQNGVKLIRTWISSLFGSGWLQWKSGRGNVDGYLPRAGLEAFQNQLTLALRAYSPTGWYDACRFDVDNGSRPVKTNTNYKLKIKYQASCVKGPLDTSSPDYGVVGIISNPFDWPNSCHLPYSQGDSRVVTNFGHDTNGWTTVEGNWNSGNLNFLPRVAFGLNNVVNDTTCSGIGGNTGAKAWIDSISLKEDLGNGQFGPEILAEPSMRYDTYFEEDAAFRLDKAIEQAEKNGVYIKTVLMEKNDTIWYKLNDDGSYASTSDNADGVYGVVRTFNKTRWLQQAYYRYLQARWGYSTAIHSWEAMNEGDPYGGGGPPNLPEVSHWAMTDEMAKYFHTFNNRHMATTSFWSDWYPDFWGGSQYANVDYADVHDYINKPSEPGNYYDTALATYNLASNTFGTSKPVVRGETGLIIDDGTDNFSQELDANGVWLHNFLWGQINNYGLSEIWWHTIQIKNNQWKYYRDFYDFIYNIPLNKGDYVDALASATDTTNIRVWGQKNNSGQNSTRAHVWVQNKKHLWCSVAGITNAYCPTWDSSRLNGNVTISGFAPGTYPVEYWSFDNNVNLANTTGTVTVDGTGNLILNVDALPQTVTDVGIKIGNYNVVSVAGDLNGDGKVDILDLHLAIKNFSSVFDITNVIANYGK